MPSVGHHVGRVGDPPALLEPIKAGANLGELTLLDRRRQPLRVGDQPGQQVVLAALGNAGDALGFEPEGEGDDAGAHVGKVALAVSPCVNAELKVSQEKLHALGGLEGAGWSLKNDALCYQMSPVAPYVFGIWADLF